MRNTKILHVSGRFQKDVSFRNEKRHAIPQPQRWRTFARQILFGPWCLAFLFPFHSEKRIMTRVFDTYEKNNKPNLTRITNNELSLSFGATTTFTHFRLFPLPTLSYVEWMYFRQTLTRNLYFFARCFTELGNDNWSVGCLINEWTSCTV